MAFFDNGEPEDLLLFMQNFKIMLNASGTLVYNKNIQYIRTII